MILQTPSLFHFIYIAEILAFSLCILTLQARTWAVILWIISNAISMASGLLATSVLLFQNSQFAAMGAGLAVIAVTLKSLCFSTAIIWRRSNLIPNMLTILAFAIGLALIIWIDTPFRLFLIVLGSIAATLSCLLYLYSNKMWAGLRPVIFTSGMLGAALLGLLFILPKAYPIGSLIRFSDQTANLLSLCIFIFFFNMAFIGLIVARHNREQFLQMRRFQRVKAAAEQSAKMQQQDAAVADERYHLLKMLTHEVRQPLNTAQAAIQTVIDQLKQRQAAHKQMEQTAEKAQSTLNSIVLSISNSILGATLITNGRPARLDLIDLCDVASLALLDLDPSQRGRVEQKFEQLEIYADADPIVLRLAIRNLLENALKYSPPHTSILFELVTDEEKLASVIRVTNDLIDPSMLSGDIFQLNRRGVDSQYEGSGLGLYIVRKVAEMHEGDICYRTVNSHRVAFELSIPAW